MKLLAIDSGNIQSAYIIFDTFENRVVKKNLLQNEEFLLKLKDLQFDEVAIEKIVSLGMPIGNTTIDTIFFNGRLHEFFLNNFFLKPNWYTRMDIRMHLCLTTRAKDGNVRAALINRFGEPSTKKLSHNIYNELEDKIYFGTHFWSCLAVAMYHLEPHHSLPIQIDNYGNILKNEK